MNSKDQEVDHGKRAFIRLSLMVGIGGVITAAIPQPAKAFFEPEETDSPVVNPPTLQSSFLMYHEMSYSVFKRDLLNLIRSGKQPISPDTAVSVIDGRETIPDSLKTFMVTCDDSLFSQYDSILRVTEEIVNETGFFVPVTFCAIMKLDNPAGPISELPENTPMYNDRVHKYLTLKQVINLIQAGHILANHTVNHALLPNLPESARNAEVEVAEQRINDIYQMTGATRPVKIFAYPEGRYQGQINYIGQQGFDLAFSTLPVSIHTQETRWYAGRIKPG